MKGTSWQDHIALGRKILVDGGATFCVDLGQGESVLMIHGWGASSFSFRKNYRELSKSFRAVAVDLPGFGLSEKLRGPLTLISVVEHLYRFIEALGAETVSLVGHSMGGAVAVAFASIYPDKVRRLMLINPSLQVRGHGGRPFFTELVRSRAIAKLLTPFLLNKGFVRRALVSAVWNKEIVDDEMVTGYYMSVKNSGTTLIEATGITDDFHVSLLYMVRAPILFLLGEKDAWVPPDVNIELAKKVGAEVVVAQETGHIVQEERPELFNEALVKFLSR
ncbi:MAG: alpha/beta hydrolase [Nitrososphaerota archaeon]